MDALEAPPVQLIRCPSCSHKLCDKLPGYRTLFRCQDCPLGCFKCIDCVLSSHGERPFDRILMWDAAKQYWHRITLPQMGYVFNLGHGGRKCPNASSAPRDMVIIHEHGLMDLPVLFCQCGSAHAPAAQLIASGTVACYLGASSYGDHTQCPRSLPQSQPCRPDEHVRLHQSSERHDR